MKPGISFCILLLSTSTLAGSLPDEALIKYIDGRVTSGEYVGMIVGLIDGDDTIVQAFGHKSLAGTYPPDKDTIFEISSISKTFAATLLAQSVVDGDMSLSDTANEHLGPGVRFATYNGREITLLDLASHQSGLPYMPTDIVPGEGPNPYAGTNDDDLTRAINAYVPQSPAGEGYSYSAFAYGTIALVLSAHQGASFAEMVHDRITLPLNMRDTVMTLDADQIRRLAPGYTKEGEVAAPLEQGVFRAAGSMYSTLHDMLIWLKANMGRIDTPLDEAIRMTHPLRNDLGTVGLAWHKSDDHNDRSQFGTAHGYRAYVGFLEDGSKGVVVLANTRANVVDIGDRLLHGRELPLVGIPHHSN